MSRIESMNYSAMNDVSMSLWHRHEKVRFLAVGVWNTAFAYGAYASLFILLKDQIHYLVIGVFAHILSVTNAFICQRWLVFRSTGTWLGPYFRFHLAQILMLGWGMVGLIFTVEFLHFTPLVGQFLVILVTVVASYFLSRNFAFRK